MKIIILNENLKKGLNIVERTTGKNLTLPSLNNVLLKAEKSFLEFSTTDLEIGLRWQELAKIEEGGKVSVPAKIFSHFINLLPDKKTILETKDNFLYVKCGNYQSKIKGFDPEEFPIIPIIQDKEFVEIDGKKLLEGLTQIIDVASLSQTRPEISGVYFLFQKDLIKIVATDSFRLAEKKLYLGEIEHKSHISKEYSFILPQKSVYELINILSENKEKVKISISPNQVLFENIKKEISSPKFFISSRLIEGEYPKYEEIIPKKYKTQIIVDRNEFINQVRIASLFSGRINEVKFKIEPQNRKMTISSFNPEFGENESFIPCQIKGEKIEISFNYKFLLDGLSKIKTPDLIFELNKVDGPGVLKPLDDISYIYIVMPIKTD